jgi:hypothetical protein
MGANAIFMHTYNTEYGAFYSTTYQDTEMEQGFGIQNMLGELISAVHAKNIKVVAWLPVNNFEKVWTNHPDWREKKVDGTDYRPDASLYLLSPLHDSFKTWYKGFLEDLFTRYPSLDGAEAAEGFVDWGWNGGADYNPVANQKYFAAYPSGQLGDANWKIFRAKGLTALYEILFNVSHARGKPAYVVQTWAAYANGHLMNSTDIRDGCGLDFDGVMNKMASTDYMMAELIWQQEASYASSTAIFNPDWTGQAKNEFLTKVGGRAKALVHVELSTFGAYTPTNTQFQTSLTHAITGTAGADFYDHNLMEQKSAMPNAQAVYTIN